MAAKRLVAFPLVFLVGVAAGGPAARQLWERPVDGGRARLHALRVLDSAPAAYDAGDNRMVEAVRRIEPAVVNIDTVGRAHGEKDVPPAFRRDTRGKGSGVVLTPDGFIVTNDHVIEGAKRIRVTLPDGTWRYARRVGSDPATDLAVVKIEAAGLAAAELADSDRMAVGEWSIAVGNPLGLGSTITVGVVSALNRRNLLVDEGRSLDGAIQTDAAINRGNSGGALANIHGQLVGINTAILSAGPGGGNIGLGFAVPANTVRRVARELIRTGRAEDVRPKQAWLGVRFEPLDEAAEPVPVKAEAPGVVVREVLPGTPASAAGVRAGDVILEMDGSPIGDGRDVREAVLRRQVGETAEVRVYRAGAGRALTVRVVMRERPDDLPTP